MSWRKILNNMTTYQKQKKQIAELTAQIVALVENKDALKVAEIKAIWKMKIDGDAILMYGETAFDNSTIGIRNIIK